MLTQLDPIEQRLEAMEVTFNTLITQGSITPGLVRLFHVRVRYMGETQLGNVIVKLERCFRVLSHTTEPEAQSQVIDRIHFLLRGSAPR